MPVSVEEASAITLRSIAALAEEEIKIADAFGRVLSHDVKSDVVLPPWNNAGMDGYAVRSADFETASLPLSLPVTGTIAAGSRTVPALAELSAMRIMTGAPLPNGADSVIRIEDTDRGTSQVEIRDARDLKRNVRYRGDELAVGDVVARGGSVISPAHVGLLASVGCSRIRVHKVPRVAVLASGDELVDLDRFAEVKSGHAIVSSNSYSIKAAALSAGATIADYGIVRDDPRALANRIDAARSSDLVVTTGGVSVGAFDFTRDVIKQLGGEVLIDRVKMRPGAPMAFGLIQGVPWLGLPGNPVSALATLELFARPIIRRLRGERAIFPLPVPCVAGDEIELAAPLTHFLRCVLTPDDDGDLVARLPGNQSSAQLSSMALASALLIVPGELTNVRIGERLAALPIGDGPRSERLRLSLYAAAAHE
jgi:molybdopterin molybdotransferase